MKRKDNYILIKQIYWVSSRKNKVNFVSGERKKKAFYFESYYLGKKAENLVEGQKLFKMDSISQFTSQKPRPLIFYKNGKTSGFIWCEGTIWNIYFIFCLNATIQNNLAFILCSYDIPTLIYLCFS